MGLSLPGESSDEEVFWKNDNTSIIFCLLCRNIDFPRFDFFEIREKQPYEGFRSEPESPLMKRTATEQFLNDLLV